MSNYNYQYLIQQISNMSTWQMVAASAVTAEKVSPIIRSLALPATWRTTKLSLDLAWRSVIDLRAHSEEAQFLLHELNAVPEWQCEYPDTLIFAVSKPLDLVRFILTTISSTSNSDMINNIGFSHVLDIADELDVAASDFPDFVAASYSIRNAEQLSQMSIVAALKDQNAPTKVLLEKLQQEAESISKLVKVALPTFCYGFVSAICQDNSQ